MYITDNSKEQQKSGCPLSQGLGTRRFTICSQTFMVLDTKPSQSSVGKNGTESQRSPLKSADR